MVMDNFPTVNQVDKLPKDDRVYAFSNGSEALRWYGENCDRCKKSFDGVHLKESTCRSYVRNGKYCKLQYYIDLGFLFGYIPISIAPSIGWSSESGCPEICLLWSDNDDDQWRPPKTPKPDRTPSNQVLLFSDFDDMINADTELETLQEHHLTSST